MSSVLPITILCVLSWSLIIVAIIRRYASTLLRAQTSKLIAFLIIAVLIGTPLFGSPLVYYPRSLLGDFSLSTTLLITIVALHPQVGNNHFKKQLRCCAVVAITSAVILYPATLGLSLTDPYQWGFNPRWMIATIGTLSVISWAVKQWVLASMLTVATLGFTLQILESTNYWDYLIDPVIVVASLIFLLASATLRTRQVAAHGSQATE